jgi:hypothetical protein
LPALRATLTRHFPPDRFAFAVVALLVMTPLAFWAIAASPGPESTRSAGLAGFVLGLLPLAVLAAALLLSAFSTGGLVVMLTAGLLLGLLLSAAGYFFLASAFKALAALALGLLLGREVLKAWWLALAAALAFLVDIWSVFAGPTRAVVERAPQALDYLVVHFPGLGIDGPAAGLGMSDFVFLGLLSGGAATTGLRPRATLAAGLASFVLTFLLALASGRPLPALPLLCLAFLAVNADRLLRRV